MSAAGNHIKAWAALLRLSNLPTIFSNALTGTALGLGALMEGSEPGNYPWRTALLTSAGLGGLYLAGMVGNDVCDRAVDLVERPQRPLASGRISLRAARWACVVLGSLGIGILAGLRMQAGVLALGLAGVIWVYNRWHGRGTMMVLLLGLCRALTYVIAGTVIAWPMRWQPVLPGALVLGGYVTGLSLLARHEAGNPRRMRIVATLLSGISLVDAAILALLGQYLPAAAAVGCFSLTRAGQRWIKGT